MPGPPPNLQQLMAQAQKMQQQMMAAQAELAEAHVDGQTAGGLVKAVVTGQGDLVSLEIDPSVVDPADVETLQDLVVAAVRDAAANARTVAAATMGPLSAGMGGMGLPGF
ncbi:YbaB/EbfC family nucleoid-associated protein [Acidothermaceae bacterium B102]|nr:YbaB/EbfC family nucleoid-associated protein [Acidothermaceae bacterium B102]